MPGALGRALGLGMQLALLAALAAFSAYATFRYFSRARPSNPTPELVGIPVAEAIARVSESGFSLRRIGEEEADWAEVGTVLAQQPEPGRVVKEGAVIEVILARSGQSRRMPDLLGLDIEQARRLLEFNQLTEGRTVLMEQVGRRRGTVLGTQPGPGEPAERGQPVDWLVAGPAPARRFRMPDLTDRSMGEVLEALDRANLSQVELVYESVPDRIDGVVLSQSPAHGVPFWSNETIRLSINRKFAQLDGSEQWRWRVAARRVPYGLSRRQVRLVMADEGRVRELAENWMEPGSVFRHLYLAGPRASAILYLDGRQAAQWGPDGLISMESFR